MFPNPSFIRDFYIPNPFLQMYTQLRSKSMKATDNLAFVPLSLDSISQNGVKKPPPIKPVREDEI